METHQKLKNLEAKLLKYPTHEIYNLTVESHLLIVQELLALKCVVLSKLVSNPEPQEIRFNNFIFSDSNLVVNAYYNGELEEKCPLLDKAISEIVKIQIERYKSKVQEAVEIVIKKVQ